MENSKNSMQVDSYIWGSEIIIWGYDQSHKYTFKVLEPKKGRLGCLSLQYHNQKSESWFVVRGIAWALVVVGDTVCTRIMKSGAIQNLGGGTIHRLMGVSDDCRVLEPSTPDAHAADKTVTKDVVRLHCVLGRETALPADEKQAKVIARAIEVTEEACYAIENGELPKEYNLDKLLGISGYTI